MYYFIIILYFFTCFICQSEEYVTVFQAKVKNLKEFNISKNEKFRSYNLESTFTDNFGNYGKFFSIITSDV